MSQVPDPNTQVKGPRSKVEGPKSKLSILVADNSRTRFHERLSLHTARTIHILARGSGSAPLGEGTHVSDAHRVLLWTGEVDRNRLSSQHIDRESDDLSKALCFLLSRTLRDSFALRLKKMRWEV